MAFAMSGEDPEGRALVVFSDTGDHWVQRWLRLGFKHVAIIVPDRGRWVAIDWRTGWPRIGIVADVEFDLGKYHREHGRIVIEVALPNDEEIDEMSPPGPLVLLSCVTFVKRFLGIRAPFVLTPWQLHQHLIRAEGMTDG